MVLCQRLVDVGVCRRDIISMYCLNELIPTHHPLAMPAAEPGSLYEDEHQNFSENNRNVSFSSGMRTGTFQKRGNPVQKEETPSTPSKMYQISACWVKPDTIYFSKF